MKISCLTLSGSIVFPWGLLKFTTPAMTRNSTAIQWVDLWLGGSLRFGMTWWLDFQHGGSLVHIEKDLVEPSSEWTYYAQRTTCESPASAFHEHFPNCHNWQLHDHQHASPWHQKSQRTAAQGCTWSISEPYQYPKAVRFKLLRVAATSVPVEFWWKSLVHLIPGGDGWGGNNGGPWLTHRSRDSLWFLSYSLKRLTWWHSPAIKHSEPSATVTNHH